MTCWGRFLPIFALASNETGFLVSMLELPNTALSINLLSYSGAMVEMLGGCRNNAALHISPTAFK